jgi:site-specific recombinase XerD
MEAAMLEDHVKSPSTCRRLREGPAGPHIDAFVESLVLQGYSPIAVTEKCQFLISFMDWIARHRFGDDIAAGVGAYRAALTARRRLRDGKGHINRSMTAGGRYLQFLLREGMVPSAKLPREVWPVLGEYHAWGLEHRGLAETTLRLYEDVLGDFLATWGDNPASYTAQALRDYVIQRARPHGVRRGETIVCAVRSFLRYLVAMGKCRDGMPDAIPRFASWNLSSVPRYLEPVVVQKVIDACQPTTAARSRDRAILLLLARLGLRAGDVAALTLGDIDWRGARVAVSGKSRRREWLPLPQEVGDAILDYLRHGRPTAKLATVFMTARAPHRPLRNGTVSKIADTAIRRAGVESPTHGAHVFRHSAATAMLRHGATLASIGTVLRHRSPDTTLQYAKIDFASLVEVAMPWPEAASC